ncbi:glycosyltransferase family 39 protein [Halobellus inordinatus]|uniref:glycosyltransferase family 39 protein n=1 Tax=Halobellus inordinatus TaxID=1126236 RepID=UPI00210EE113|nr:glycosyltransferase family 39 protein [Halobellus inordinatus]
MTEESTPADTGELSPREVRMVLGRLAPIDREDLRWLGIGLGAGLLAVAVYLATNPYPAYGAGLYVQIATEISAHGYGLPAWIPGYTADSVPFAYPPLQFYVLAVLLDLGGDPVVLARLLPSVGYLALLVPVYLLGRDYTNSRPAGAAASVAVAVNPQLVQWHLSAGGVVRAFALLYALTAVYAGYRIFETGSTRAVAVGTVAFGATVLTHPTYALFVVVTYLLLWILRDRSKSGFVAGAIVGVGGTVIASPWLVWVLTTHGIDVFVAAGGTHGGIGGGIPTILDGASLTLLPLAGAVYLYVARRDVFLLSWTVVAELVFAQPRFVFLVGALVVAAVGVDFAQRVEPLDGHVNEAIDKKTVLAAVCLVAGATVGGAYLAHEMTLTSDPSTPQFLDSDDLDAMAWVAAETPPDVTFVVLGDAAEWLPALTDRTLLVGPWGVEWRDSEMYDRQLTAYESVSRCQSVTCVESMAGPVSVSPDYVYIPKGQYTIRGESTAQFGTLERSFERSSSWERSYENDGVVVYRASG